MKEHEKLKRICDEIGHAPEFEYGDLDGDGFDDYFGEYDKGTGFHRMVDVREIIFNPEFKDAFEKELKNRRLCTDERQNQIDNGDKENYITDEQIEMQCDYAMFGLLYNLHDPVTYLYNLLFNK